MMMVWILFIVAILLFLALDLGVFNKKSQIINSKEAVVWTGIWITLAFAFSGVVYWLYSSNYITNPDHLKPEVAALKFITGYLIELSLSADNIFVIAVVFASFKIAQKHQHRILFWGILGAILFRGLLIFLGVISMQQIHWITYVFGGFLVYTALKMLFKKNEDEMDPKESFVYKMIGKVIPVTKHNYNDHFFINKDNRTFATPLFITLIVIEVMDVVFALDSVPAILAITADPFLVFSSNIFAILGLRTMFFLLTNMLEKFRYLEHSLIAILIFVGIKMLIINYYKIPEWISLSVIVVSLLVGILVSVKIINNNKL